jgi:hypothetical protein
MCLAAKGWLSARCYHVLKFNEMSNRVAHNGQVLPMVGNFIFVRPELLPGFLIKLNVKNLPAGRQAKAGLYSSSPEPQYNRITAADCFNVKPHYWQYQC